ncbi:MAG: tRNA (adenosine(37)-N6)-dimethylallyltransferase MiaA [Candidatus Fermentibacter sp.]|nr:tRNA (adenosine(37)-N6)-dimethylallyltransferase MiaA [Candidatus Fermentibacter sp.]
MTPAPPIPVITGCTASGKTGLALAMAARIRMEVISADSRQIYRMMDIGTAKPTREEREAVPHHLLDIMDPDGTYSAGRFAREASALAPAIRARGAVPVVVGGTGLYLLALTGRFDPLPQADGTLRSILSACECSSRGFVRRCLARLDPASAGTLHPSDAVRALRALEITLLSGRRASSLRTGGPGRGDVFRIARVDVPGPDLRRRISARTRSMLESGLVDEVRRLSAAGFGRDCAPGRTIGYREVLDSLEAGGSGDDAATAIENGTWRFSRRQRNMLGRLPADLVTDGGDPGALFETLFGDGVP